MSYRLAALGALSLHALAASDAPCIQPSAAAYTPPTWRERREVFLRKMFGAEAVFETAPGAAFDTVREFPASWGRGANGFGKRMLSQYGQFAVGEGIELGVAAFKKEDPRYQRVGDGARMSRRLGHLLASGVMTRNSRGENTVAVSRLANIYGSWAIASRWNPPEVRGARSVMLNGTLGLGIKVGANAFREFWPDVKKRWKK